MLLSLVKKQIQNKCSASFSVPKDEILCDIIYEAMLYVCTLCIPNELLRKDLTLEKNYVEVFRLIKNGMYIKSPEYPDFSGSNRHLQIDEALTYAVIYYSCFIIGKMKELQLKKLCDDIIGVYNTNFSDVWYEE
jgi:hypothetical protein